MAEQRLLPTHSIHLAPFHSKLPFHTLRGPTHRLTNPSQNNVTLRISRSNGVLPDTVTHDAMLYSGSPPHNVTLFSNLDTEMPANGFELFCKCVGAMDCEPHVHHSMVIVHAPP